MNLILATLKSKGLSILCIVLATLLTASYLSGKADRVKLTATQGKLLAHVQLNKRLSDQNLELAEEIKTKPAEYITITKEVSKEVCTGVVKQQLINAIPSKKGVNNGTTAQNTADIDDRLPDNLLKLLK
jgi:hypothetical protein